MVKVYIYPTYTPTRDKSGNLYIKYFHEAFEKHSECTVVNRFWQIGIASMIFNLDSDVFIIQWVDLIPGKRLGKIQFFFYLILVFVADLLGKKIIWVLHNKFAHNGKSKLVDYGMAFMAEHASKVFPHQKEGIRFFDQQFPKYAGKCSYIPHPVYTQNIYPALPIEYDYIIWGGIGRRKQVAEFLHEANQMPFFEDKKILVVGNCSDKEYENEILKELKPNSIFINRFLSDIELQQYIQKSRCVLFTYRPDSMLSSGAMIYSINFCKPIIGPNAGCFADEKDISETYDNFSEIPNAKLKDNTEACISYLNTNSWDKLPARVLYLLYCNSSY